MIKSAKKKSSHSNLKNEMTNRRKIIIQLVKRQIDNAHLVSLAAG
jgi:hypothetical protein